MKFRGSIYSADSIVSSYPAGAGEFDIFVEVHFPISRLGVTRSNYIHGEAEKQSPYITNLII